MSAKEMMGFTNGSVTSRDGTAIAYRRLGQGPGLILLHGGLNAGQHLMRLAEELSDTFTVYVPDRRGHGSSPHAAEGHTLAREREDVEALLAHTGAGRIFGHSVGGVVALFSALAFKSIRKAAAFEPPLSIGGSSPMQWFPRYCREVEEGRIPDALVTALTGMRLAPPMFVWLPRLVLIPLMRWANAGGTQDVKDGFAAVTDLIPTLRMDIPLIIETEDTLPTLAQLDTDTLLLGGSRGPAYLQQTLDALERTLPRGRRVRLRGLDHLGPSNEGAPERVAAELKRFFLEPIPGTRPESSARADGPADQQIRA